MKNRNDLDDVNSDYSDDDYESGSQGWLSAFVIILAVASVVALGVYAFNVGNSSVSVEETPLISADSSPIKETPADPGGMQFPHQDKTVYETITNDKPGEKPVAERILPAPEEPEAPKKTVEAESWINEKLHPKDEPKAEETPAVKAEEVKVDSEEETPSKEASAEEAHKAKIVKLMNDGNKVEAVASAPLAADVKKIKVINVKEEMEKLAAADKADKVETKETAGKVAKVETKDVAAEISSLPDIEPVVKEISAEKAGELAPAAGGKAAEPKVVKVEEKKAEAKKEIQLAKADEADAKPVSKAAAGKHKVQLGAFKSEKEAGEFWKKFSSKNSDALDGRKHAVQRADLGAKGVFYRLQVQGFGSKESAQAFCDTLSKRKQGCFPVKAN